MEYVYAAMLLHETEVEITSDSVERVLQSADVDVDPGRMYHFLRQIEDENLDEFIPEMSELEAEELPGSEVDARHVYAALLLDAAESDISSSALANVLRAAGARTTWDEIQAYAVVFEEMAIEELLSEDASAETTESADPDSSPDPTTTEESAPTQTDSPSLTRSEDVTLTGLNTSVTVKGKCDTGADITSVDATLAGEVGLGPIKGKDRVRTASELVEVRVVAEAELEIGPFPAEEMDIVIADRSDMTHPILIGWDFLEGKDTEIT